MSRPTSMYLVWLWLGAHHLSTSQEVAVAFWPEKAAMGTQDGGPTRGASIAMRLLGRMQRSGMVGKVKHGASPARWFSKAARA